MSVVAIVEAITVLAPLVEKVAGYIAGEHDELPEVPEQLKGAVELKRYEERARKAALEP